MLPRNAKQVASRSCAEPSYELALRLTLSSGEQRKLSLAADDVAQLDSQLGRLAAHFAKCRRYH